MCRHFAATALCWTVLTPWAARAAEGLLDHGGMEGPFVHGVAAGWVNNCYGDNDVVFAEETQDVRGGRAAQRVTCRKFTSGGVQLHSSDVAVEKGQTYTLRLWMKGDVRSPIYVGVRQYGEPYTSYLGRHVRVRNEWRPYILTGTASGTDPRCAIFIMFADVGTLWIDEVTLQPGSAQEEVPAADLAVVKGNRVFNSGFEAGSEGWTPTDGFVLDETTAHSGRFSARLSPRGLTAGAAPVNVPGARAVRPRRTPPGLECRPFAVRADMPYTFSAWVKGAVPDTAVTLRFFEWADEGGDQPSQRDEHSATVNVTTEWTRVQVSGRALPQMWDDYVVRIVPHGTVRIDDVQVEEGELSDYRPAHEVEVGAESTTRWCLTGEPVDVAAHVTGVELGHSVHLTYTLEDLWTRPLQVITRPSEGGVPNRARFVVEQPGMFRVRVQADDSPATGEVWFGVFPHRDRTPQPDSPFGTHVAGTVPEPTNTLLASAAMGARWVRLHDFGDYCHWYVVEPEQGRFVWHDAEIDDLCARGFHILANLGHPPLWAGRTDPPGKNQGGWTNAPPRDMVEWEEYVFQTVAHYRDRIRHWEIWNEPNWVTFFAGTPEEYAELLRVAYAAIRRADPQATVIGGCFSYHTPDWTRRVLARNALDFMDVLSYHTYWSPAVTEPAATGEPTLVEQEVQHFRDLMQARGYAKPIYMTEGGLRCPPFASWLPKEGFSRGAPFGSAAGASEPLTSLDAASGLVRGMVQMRTAGVANICYYYSGGDWGAMPWFSTMANGYYVLMDYDGRPKSTMMAYSALEQQLGAATPVGRRTHDGLTVHLFQKEAGTVAVVWSDAPRPLEVDGATVLDLMGNVAQQPALRPGEPVYVVAPNLSADALADRLR